MEISRYKSTPLSGPADWVILRPSASLRAERNPSGEARFRRLSVRLLLFLSEETVVQGCLGKLSQAHALRDTRTHKHAYLAYILAARLRGPLFCACHLKLAGEAEWLGHNSLQVALSCHTAQSLVQNGAELYFLPLADAIVGNTSNLSLSCQYRFDLLSDASRGRHGGGGKVGMVIRAQAWAGPKKAWKLNVYMNRKWNRGHTAILVQGTQNSLLCPWLYPAKAIGI